MRRRNDQCCASWTTRSGWIASAQVLAFVARRLLAESVGAVFATRERGEELAGLPELVVEGLESDDARAVLASALRAPLDEGVADRIVEETRGNPLALLELPRGLSPAQLTELTHPYYAFARVRYGVTIASPDGGPVEVDTLSDLRDASKWSADDLISMGFLCTPELAAARGHPAPRRPRPRRVRRDRRVRRPRPDVPVPRERGPQADDRDLLRGREADGPAVPRRLRAHRRAALGRVVSRQGQDRHRLRERRRGLLRPVGRAEGDALPHRGRAS
jgi:hypothetical protein